MSYLECGWLTWNSVIDGTTLKMPLTSSVNEFFLFSLHCIRLLILPWVSVSFSRCFSPCVHLHTPSATFLSCSVSLVYLCSPLIGLRQAQFLWPLVPCPASSLSRGMNKSEDQFFSLPFPLHARTHAQTPFCHIAQILACLPTNYHTTSPALPHVPMPHLNLFPTASSFHYSLHIHFYHL